MDSTDSFQQKLNLFYKRYRDPQSGFFLESNTNRIYEESKRDSYLHSVTRKEILRFKNSLSTLSKNKERRILRGRKRVCSYRKWISWGPKNILLGDLCFIPNPRNPNGKKYTLLVLLDAFSRLCFVSILRNATSKETAEQLERAFDFFGGPPLKFSSDRGTSSFFYFLTVSLTLILTLTLFITYPFCLTLFVYQDPNLVKTLETN